MTAKDIIAEVAAKHALVPADLIGGCNVRPFVIARHEAMARIRVELAWSYPAIGKLFGKRHHTTVLSAVRGFLGHSPGVAPGRTQSLKAALLRQASMIRELSRQVTWLAGELERARKSA